MEIPRCWCSTPNGAKLFAINLPFTTKQYKVDNIANFVCYGKTRLMIQLETIEHDYIRILKSQY